MNKLKNNYGINESNASNIKLRNQGMQSDKILNYMQTQDRTQFNLSANK